MHLVVPLKGKPVNADGQSQLHLPYHSFPRSFILFGFSQTSTSVDDTICLSLLDFLSTKHSLRNIHFDG